MRRPPEAGDAKVPSLSETLVACRLVQHDLSDSALAAPLVTHYLHAAIVKQPAGSGFNVVRAKNWKKLFEEEGMCQMTPSQTLVSEVYRCYFGSVCASVAWQVSLLLSTTGYSRVCVSEAPIHCVTELLPGYSGQRRTSIASGDLNPLQPIEDARHGAPHVLPEARKLNAGLMDTFPRGIPSRVLVLGQGGTGKSLLGKQVILEMCRVSLDGGVRFAPRVIPFRIHLASFAPSLVDDSAGWDAIATFFADVVGPQSVQEKAARCVEAQRDPALLMLDGFDEVHGASYGETQRRRRALLTWARSFTSSLLYVLVTSRLTAIERWREAFGELGYVARRVVPLAVSASAEVLDNTLDRLGLAGDERAAVIAKIQRPEYRSLAQVPFMLILLANVLTSEVASAQILSATQVHSSTLQQQGVHCGG